MATVYSKLSGSFEGLSPGREEQVTENITEWALTGMGATAIAGGSQGWLFPEWAPDKRDLRGKRLPGEHQAAPGSISLTRKLLPGTGLFVCGYEGLCWVGVGGVHGKNGCQRTMATESGGQCQEQLLLVLNILQCSWGCFCYCLEVKWSSRPHW